MKVVLIFPRSKYKSGDPPLGVAYLAAALKCNGIEVSILDTTFNSSFEHVEAFLEKEKPTFVGIYIDTTMFNDASAIIDIIKKFNIPIIAGGPHPTVCPETIINMVDVVVIGEGEETLVKVIENYPNLIDIKGIWYKNAGKVIKNPLRQPIADLDSLPFPARELLDIEGYTKYWHYLDSIDPKLRGTNMITSRGCPFQCTYCQPTLNKLFGLRIRKRSPKNVIEEIKHVRAIHRIDAIFFHDDTLTADKKWVDDFCSLLKKEDLNMIWGCNTRVDTVTGELMKKMYEAGLRCFHIGIESGSKRVLDKIYKKSIVFDDVKFVVDSARKIGIHTLGFFMLGAPTETKEEINKTINFAASLRLNEASFSITSPLPATQLYNIVKNSGYEISNNYSDFDYYSKRAFNDPYLPYKTLKYYQKKALLRFYLHPYRWSYLIKHFSSVEGLRKMYTKIRRFV